MALALSFGFRGGVRDSVIEDLDTHTCRISAAAAYRRQRIRQMEVMKRHRLSGRSRPQMQSFEWRLRVHPLSSRVLLSVIH